MLTYSYDNLDRSFGYDVFGRLVSASGNGTIALSWDGFGRMTAETGPFGRVGYAYDAAGRRSRLTWPDGYYVSYDYFDDGALAHIRENGAASGPGVLATFSYDGLGRRTRLDRGNGAATTYAPDALSRLAGLNHAFSGGAGNVAWSYEHNPANGLRSAARDNDGYAWAGHYAVNRAYISNGRNQYTAAGATGFGYDANGNLTSDGARGFEYDAGNRLTVGYVGAAHQELIDDPRDRLFRYYDGTANRWLIYDGTDLIAEVDGNGTTLRRYVHGPGVPAPAEAGEPLVWYEGAGTGDRRWLHADAQGSIVALSDANGALLNINRYDEYGIPGAGNAGRFQYTGQAWLAELGMYYYKARIYSPTLGRFMQTDPVGYEGGINLYGYVGDDPVNGRDPTGLFDCCYGSDGYHAPSVGQPTTENFLHGVLSYPRDLAIEIRHDIRLTGLLGREAQNRALLVDALADRAVSWAWGHPGQVLDMARSYVLDHKAHIAGRLAAGALALRYAGPAARGLSLAAFSGGGVHALNGVVSALEENRISVGTLSDRSLSSVFVAGGLGARVGFDARTGNITATISMTGTGTRLTHTRSMVICNIRTSCNR